MSYNYKGRHVTIDEQNPQALGICDYSGFVHNRKDLIRQMEWRGNRLVWTGFYVGKTYSDKPNEQLRVPILPPDPVPVRDPRLQQPTNITWSNNYNAIWGSLVVWAWDSWFGSEDGIPCLSPGERLFLLQQGGNFGSPSFSNGVTPQAPYLTEDQKLDALNSFNWNQQ